MKKRKFAVKMMAWFVSVFVAMAFSVTLSFAGEHELVIGVDDALTGPGAVYGLPQTNAVKMAVDQINKSGGLVVKGEKYKFKVVAYDDKANPTEATNAVRRLIDRDGAKYLLGFCCSGSTSAVASMISRENAIMLVGNAAERSITTKGLKNLFRTRPPADYTGAAAGRFVAKKGPKRIAVIGALDISFYKMYVDAFQKEFEKSGGKIITRETFSIKDRDMNPQLTKIRALKPDALLVVGYVEPAAFVYRQAYELGINVPKFGFTSGSEEQFLRVVTSKEMEGVWDLRPTELTLQSASKNGLAYYNNYSNMYGIHPSPSSPYAYDQVYVLKHALEAAGTVDDIQAVAKAIKGLSIPSEAVMKYIPVDGKMFDSNGQAYTSNAAFQWRNGKWVYVEDLPSDPKAYSEFLSSLRQ
jgi:branched-chain amino acid transport system substrate-binding protein